MNKYLEIVKETLKRKKKKLIIGASVIVVATVGLGGAGFLYVYNKAKSNINYTVDEAKAIAIEAVGGNILRVDKKIEFELGHFIFEYEFKILDSYNILREVTVDSRLGVITDVD